jgi:hypothetical protein
MKSRRRWIRLWLFVHWKVDHRVGDHRLVAVDLFGRDVEHAVLVLGAGASAVLVEADLWLRIGLGRGRIGERSRGDEQGGQNEKSHTETTRLGR